MQAEKWQDGFAITAAPLYFDGTVIVGFNGGVAEYITSMLPGKGAAASKP